MKFLIIIAGVFLLAFLTFCNQPDRPENRIERLNTNDTFLFESHIPKWQPDSLFRKRKMLFEKSLGLDFLEKGFDSIQLRITYGCVMTTQRIIVLTNRGYNWTAEISVLESYANPEYENDMDVHENNFLYRRTISHKTPKSGWEKFIRKLFSFNILTMPDAEQLDNYKKNAPSVSDGCGIDIEVATKKVYRYYGYSNPDMITEVYQEARDIVSIASLLNTEFGIIDWPDDEEENSDEKSDTITTREIKLEDIRQN